MVVTWISSPILYDVLMLVCENLTNCIDFLRFRMIYSTNMKTLNKATLELTLKFESHFWDYISLYKNHEFNHNGDFIFEQNLIQRLQSVLFIGIARHTSLENPMQKIISSGFNKMVGCKKNRIGIAKGQ